MEQLALQYYASEAGGGWTGIHTEGGIWATLFGIIMWDLLFADVADVFRSPFQTGPLDLDTDAFYPARKAGIDARLQQVSLGHAAELLAAHWQAHHGVMCRGVNWESFTLEQLMEVRGVQACLGCQSAVHCCSVCHRYTSTGSAVGYRMAATCCVRYSALLL